ncbi:single-stranded-DNA-specific exonuclease RecJ [Chloracidobacterium validum]|uniref:Single-stranded-DNA-specific exonuclease RecJ n=1 Tax=Chloracidobacterium validum TaxID=2821543 RepID=A0ABX8B8P2_9BACT|nr:single-stranded-DNA-specific exonuclease RecJ [Chloracidobacterium validum]QUW03258.1 single-stranded-DNA-specific exonuclease RecJ [Chloracidobacterium validum]
MSNDMRRSLSGAIWKRAMPSETDVHRLATELGISPLVAACLVNRGITTPERATAFLAPDLAHIPDPQPMWNLDEAIRVLTGALSRRERVQIVGDYDCDGTTGLITLRNVLRLLGSEDDCVSYYVPDREREGYGLNPGIIERAAAAGVQVLVSVDIGITAHQEWDMARERGITGVCLDHHTALGSRVPSSAIVVCPKQAGDPYPEKDLAACGLAWQMARALLDERPNGAAILRSLTKLVAIGTYADLVPLSSLANRAIVAEGLRGLNQGSKNPGLAALMEVARLDQRVIGASDLGFRLGPRINAAGRIEGTTLSVIELFDSHTLEEARPRAQQIDAWNTERQDVQRRLVEQLEKRITDQAQDDFVYVLAGDHADGWKQGVVGIAASKVVETYHRPALVCSLRDGIAHGSGRSIPQFNLIEALQWVGSDGLFLRYGGHPAAAGFCLPVERLPELHRRLNEYARQTLTPDDLIRAYTYDGNLPLADLTVAFVESLARLEPHGIGNPAPRFVVRGRILEQRVLKDLHLKLILADDQARIEVLWWNQHGYAGQLPKHTLVEVLGRPDINVWNGNRTTQFIATDIRLA